MITFKEQYDKIVDAYFGNRLEPFNGCACFVGNLLNNRSAWQLVRKWNYEGKGKITEDLLHYTAGLNCIVKNSQGFYSPSDIVRIENNFLAKINENTANFSGIEEYNDKDIDTIQEHPNYEEALFIAMDSTLDLLKQIHEAKGEVVDIPKLEKRQLVTI